MAFPIFSAFSKLTAAALNAAFAAGVPAGGDVSSNVVTPTGSLTSITLAALAAKIATPDWLTGDASFNLNWPVTGAASAILSAKGQIALTTASRGSDLSSSYGSLQTTIGHASFAFNDDIFATSGRRLSVYAGYDEAQILAGAGGIAFGREIDAVNFGAAATATTPGSPLLYGAPSALWLASGGEHAGVTDANFALGIAANGAHFQTGIMIAAGALTNYAGFGFAMRMPKGSMLQWHDASDAAGPFIASSVTYASDGASLQFFDGNTSLVNNAGHASLQVNNVWASVNFPVLIPSVAGAGVTFGTAGTDANIQLNLAPQGTGIVYVTNTLGVGGGLTVTGSAAFSGIVNINSPSTGAVNFTAAVNGSGSSAGTLTNAPAAGNPAFWLPVEINGTVRHIPCW